MVCGYPKLTHHRIQALVLNSQEFFIKGGGRGLYDLFIISGYGALLNSVDTFETHAAPTGTNTGNRNDRHLKIEEVLI